MLMPMFGFVFTLLVIGGLGTVVAIGDPQGARLAPYIGFTSLFGGLGALSLSLLLAFIGFKLPASETVAAGGFLVGYILGGLGGAALGFVCALRRRARIESATNL